MTRALMLFAHGSREPAWAPSVHALADAVRLAMPDRAVSVAFLEHLAPTLPEALDRLVDEGVADAAVLPVFWAAQGHVLRDLPRLIAPAQARGLLVQVLPALSALPGMHEFVARATSRALAIQD